MTDLPNRFDADTALAKTADGRYAGRIDHGWWIINGPNGGYIAAVILRALTLEVNDAGRAPRSLTIHYLRPPAEGDVDVEVRIERTGRTLTTASARLVQGGKLCALAVAAFASTRDGFSFQDHVMPVLPPPERCERVRDRYPSSVELQQRYDARIGLGEPLGSGASRALVGGWIRFEDPRPSDALAVAAFTDSFVPAVFTRASERSTVGAVPTIDLTIHFRAALPLAGSTPEEYCAVVFTSNTSREGFIEEDGEVWSPGGVLLAQSRQLAIVT